MGSKHKRALAYEAIRVLQELADVFEKRRQQLAAEAGVSDLQWRVLEQVAEEDFMPSLFARSRSQSPAGVSRTLRQLLERTWWAFRSDAGMRVSGSTDSRRPGSDS